MRYSIPLVCLLLGCASGPWQSIRTGAMYPNLNRNSDCVVNNQTPEYAVGQVVLVDVEGVLSARRLTGMPGDRIAVMDGVVTRNGQPIVQSSVRSRAMCHMGVNARCFCRIAKETLGARTYQVQHLLPPQLDGDARCDPQYPDVAEVLVPGGHAFVMADNRDGALDSRVLGPVELSTLRGQIKRCRY